MMRCGPHLAPQTKGPYASGEAVKFEGYQDKMQAMIARPVACRSPMVAFQTTQAVRPRVLARTSRRSVLTRAEPSAAEKTLSELERAISEARKQCDEATAGECAAAWDTVEELSAAISHKKAQAKADPLEEFCDDNPDADECRVYED
ncbi:hypothetical protein WJX75_001508 [Coccomyxa subellipsoidea]|uniref:CP12 domain-containing protein n=1 Tax=Coccomyxa subellipsoidea TaxID=248742 RepID=A0ABR2Z2E9_9CHLO